MIIPSVLKCSHQLIKSVVRPGDNVIDATMGHGRDTIALAELVGAAGHVYSFDVQTPAVRDTKRKIHALHLDSRVSLYKTGHENLLDTIGMTSVKGVIFNLGYLPGGNKTIVTHARTTVAALKQCLMILLPGGLITLVLYYGQHNDPNEKDAVINFTSQLDQHKYNVLKYQFINQIHEPPILVAIQRIR